MKKISKIISITTLTLLVAGCSTTKQPSFSSALKLNVQEVCNVEKNGVEKVLATAEKYNKIAILEEVEFARLGMKNRTLIKATKEALKSGEKMVQYTDKKGKPTKEKQSVSFSAHRSCNFAISALQQKYDAKTQWRLAVPGDGYQY